MFTKRHYEAIARVLHRSNATQEVTDAIAVLFADDNYNFSYGWFYNAVRTGDMGKPK